MRLTALALCAMLALAGCGGATPAQPPTTEADAILATRTALPFTPVPTRAPTAPPLQDPADPLTIVLGGEFARDGYWTWDDISNLLGVYAQYGAYTTVTVDGQDYAGVPIAYLLDYARVNQYARGLVVFIRQGGSYAFLTDQLRACDECVIARTPEGALALITPTGHPPVIQPLVRIEAR